MRIDSVTGAKMVDEERLALRKLVGGERLLDFVQTHKVLLNALLRANPSLLEKSLKPMVSVIACRPFLDFDVKRHYFRTQLRRLRNSASRRYGNLRLNINRNTVFEDAYHQLRLRDAAEMRGRMNINFAGEEGIDAGGLTREFYEILAKDMFNPNYGLFIATSEGTTYQPNPNSFVNPDHLQYFRFVGRIVGKAVADGILLEAHFTRSFYKHLLGIKVNHSDMQSIDPDYFKNLKMILDYNLDDLGLELTMTAENETFGRIEVVDLIPNGKKIPVNDTNKKQYVQLMCHHKMTTAIKKQIDAFLQGFHELINPEIISIFNPMELELLIGGVPDLDMQDLKNNTTYDGYKPGDPVIQWFWNVVLDLNREDKAKLVQFVTGTSKVPLEGFCNLQGMRGTQKFNIHRAYGENMLPSAHTCFNQLDLPLYPSEAILKEKLMTSINEGSTGFGFA